MLRNDDGAFIPYQKFINLVATQPLYPFVMLSKKVASLGLQF